MAGRRGKEKLFARTAGTKLELARVIAERGGAGLYLIWRVAILDWTPFSFRFREFSAAADVLAMPRPPPIEPGALKERSAVAKGQDRGNREAKKPKANPKKAPAGTRVTETQLPERPAPTKGPRK